RWGPPRYPSVEGAIIVDSAVGIWQLPRRLISLAWIDGDPGPWLERPWFDDYDIILAANPETAALVRAGSSKVATEIPGDPTGSPVRHARGTWAEATRFGLR